MRCVLFSSRKRSSKRIPVSHLILAMPGRLPPGSIARGCVSAGLAPCSSRCSKTQPSMSNSRAELPGCGRDWPGAGGALLKIKSILFSVISPSRGRALGGSGEQCQLRTGRQRVGRTGSAENSGPLLFAYGSSSCRAQGKGGSLQVAQLGRK